MSPLTCWLILRIQPLLSVKPCFMGRMPPYWRWFLYERNLQNDLLQFQRQIEGFMNVRQNLTSGRLGVNGTDELIRNALFLINVSSNDCSSNYLLPQKYYRSSRQYGLIQYQNELSVVSSRLDYPPFQSTWPNLTYSLHISILVNSGFRF